MRDIALPGSRGAANSRNLGRFGFAALYNLRVTNAYLVPPQGRTILAANHTGLLDGPLLVSCAPRPTHVMSKSEYFTGPGAKFMRAAGQIPVIYDSADRNAMQNAIAILNDERALGIFPEAHRGLGDFAHTRNGIAYLHAQTSAPIVPVAILGTRSTGMGKNGLPKVRSKIDVVFGMPFTVPIEADPTVRSTLAVVGEAIRQRLTDHVQLALEQTGHVLPEDDTSLETVAALKSRR